MTGSTTSRNDSGTGTPRKPKAKDIEGDLANIVTGKRARKQIQELDFGDPDEMDEDGQRMVSKPKTVNGKPRGESCS